MDSIKAASANADNKVAAPKVSVADTTNLTANSSSGS